MKKNMFSFAGLALTVPAIAAATAAAAASAASAIAASAAAAFAAAAAAAAMFFSLSLHPVCHRARSKTGKSLAQTF